MITIGIICLILIALTIIVDFFKLMVEIHFVDVYEKIMAVKMADQNPPVIPQEETVVAAD